MNCVHFDYWTQEELEEYVHVMYGENSNVPIAPEKCNVRPSDICELAMDHENYDDFVESLERYFVDPSNISSK